MTTLSLIFPLNTPLLAFYHEPFQFQKANIFFLIRICLKFQSLALERNFQKKQGEAFKSRRAISMIFIFILVKGVSTFVTHYCPLKHSEPRSTNPKDLLLAHLAQDGSALLTKRKRGPRKTNSKKKM